MNSTKTCSKKHGCGKEKPLSEFYIRPDTGKFRNTCKLCDQKRIKRWQQNNTEKTKEYKSTWNNSNKDYYKKYRDDNREHLTNYYKKRYRENRETILEKMKKYREQNKKIIKERKKRYYNKNKKEILAKQSYLQKHNIQYKIRHSLRNRLRLAVKGGQRAGSAVKDLGCSVEELKLYLEKQFYPHPETGENMTWDNWAIDGWHIDHILPLSCFDLSSREEFLRACHYTNLQPLWAKDNLSKGAKIQ